MSFGLNLIQPAPAAVPTEVARVGFDPTKLSRFYASLPGIATNGGRDVVIGPFDSLGEGTGTTDAAKFSWGRGIGRGLQQWANRRWAPAVVGGLGYIHGYNSSGVTNAMATYSGAPVGTGFAGGTPNKFTGQTGFGLFRIDSGGAGTVTFTTTYATDIEIVFQRRIGSSVTFPWAASGPSILPNVSPGTVVTSEAGISPSWGANSPVYTTNTQGIYGEKKAALTGMTASATPLVLVFSAPSSDRVLFNGIIHYNGDRMAGLRYHNLGRASWNLRSADGSSAIYRDSQTLPIAYDEANFDNNVATKSSIQSNIDQWSWISPTDSTTVGLSARASLFIIELLTNDQSAYGNTSGTVSSGMQIYQACLQDIVNRAISRPSQPSVLLVVPPCPGGREAYFRPFKQAMHNVAASTAHCTIVDVDLHYGEPGSRDYPRDWENDSEGSEIHPSDIGAMQWTAVVLSKIIDGCPI